MAEDNITSFSPRTKAMKSVSIAESERISPLIIGNNKEPNIAEEPLELDGQSKNKQFTASLGGKRLQGRPSFERAGSRASIVDTSLAPALDEYFNISNTSSDRPESSHGHGEHNIVAQVSSWIRHEKERRDARRSARKARKEAAADLKEAVKHEEAHGDTQERRGSDSSEGSAALESLTAILEKAMIAEQSRRHSTSRRNPLSALHRRSGSFSRMRRGSKLGSSDTESIDSEPHVPTADVLLDNSKTLGYSGGQAESAADARRASTATAKERDRQAWATFKSEIVRLTHTLRLKGWKKVPRELSDEIEVSRLSGALTNAVYVVSPPKELPQPERSEKDGRPQAQRRPPKLLLRIYGPQVEHLIDRESELQILRRLARKRIGPRLLGTFINGRFEEFLHAETLTPRDLRVPETSKQIAKRMRELHEGIDLIPQERDDGPFVWKNWDKWVDRCEQVVTWLDKQVDTASERRDSIKSLSKAEQWKLRGYVCGVPWATFRKTVEKYRKWLDDQYGGPEKLKKRLVFAHNDTQYGNILRMTPSGESPLLLPANVHKQLVVIDFEYANANLPGLEFANHFTEWCYNYHDPETSHAVNTTYYPTPQEQHRFIRSYTLHRPAFSNVSTPPTPLLSASSSSMLQNSSSSISTFMLDSRVPPSPESMRARGGKERVVDEQRLKEEAELEVRTEEEVQRLMAETRVWRLANSSQWVAWGVVQAKVPGLPEVQKHKGLPNVNVDEVDDEDTSTVDGNENAEELLEEVEKVDADADKKIAAMNDEGSGDDEEEEEFDYLAYAQDRAMFFWGDAITLGIAELDDLPENIRGRVKFVNY